MRLRLKTCTILSVWTLGLSAWAAAGALSPDVRVVNQKPTPGQQRRLAGLPLPFIENRGQVDERVAFYARTFAGTAFVTRTGKLVLSLPGKREGTSTKGHATQRGPGWVLTETPVTRTTLHPQGLGLSPTRVSVFEGNDAGKWHERLETFGAVSLGQPWPGIGYAIHAHGATIERIFTVQPGAKADTIAMRVEGAEALSLDHGALIVHTGNGPVTLSRPVAYQTIDGRRSLVQVAYALTGNRYGFRLGSYDRTRPVVIDPLVQATYLGGSGDDWAQALALGAGGQVYVAGITESTDFPGTTGGAQAASGGNIDAFVAELNAGLTGLTQATYLGGSGDDQALALALGAGGEVYVAGTTASTDFPRTTGGAQTASGGGYEDAFVAELNADLTGLSQATYLGGSGDDQALALALGAGGEVYVAGITASTDFPGAAGGAQAAPGGGGDAFVAELNAGLTGLTQATYLGGSGSEYAYALALGSSGQVYVAGATASTDFPGVTGGAQTASGGIIDAFVAELNAGLTGLSQATYLGGAGRDTAVALALGGGGKVYVAGITASTDFPGAAGGAQAVPGGGSDAFVAELNAGLTGLSQATYLGGSGGDGAWALALGGGGKVYVAGDTASTDFPGTTGGAQAVPGGGGDAFVAELNAGLTGLSQATYLGGAGSDTARALALDGGKVYVAGGTDSTDFPGAAGGAQAAPGGGGDAFVAELDCLTSSACGATTYTVTATAGPNGNIAPPSQTVNANDTASFTVTPDAGYRIGTVSDTCGTGGASSGTLTGNTYTTGPVAADCAVRATFAVATASPIPTLSQSGIVSLALLLVILGWRRARVG